MVHKQERIKKTKGLHKVSNKKGKITIVMTGLIDEKNTEKQVNDFFKKQKFGTVKKLMSITTLKGQGGPGGRSDIVFLLESNNIMKFGLSPFRFNSRTSWGRDYFDNNKSIIPRGKKEKLKKLLEEYGG